jgi:hypothetical protein
VSESDCRCKEPGDLCGVGEGKYCSDARIAHNANRWRTL